MDADLINADVLALEAILNGTDRQASFHACDSLRSYFLQAWREKQGQRHSTSVLQRCELIRSLLSRSCGRGQAELTDMIVLSILEHIFQTPDIVSFFDRWKKDPVLNPIYTEAKYLATGLQDKQSTKKGQIKGPYPR